MKIRTDRQNPALSAQNASENPKNSAKKGKNRPDRESRRDRLAANLLSSPIFRLLALLTVAMTGWVAAHLFMPYGEGLLLLCFPLTALGFALQTLLERILPLGRSGKVSFHRGIPGLILLIVLFFATAPTVREFIAPRIPSAFDLDSWVVFTVGFMLILSVSGLFCAMIDPEKFFSYNSAYTFAGIYLAVWFLSFFTADFPQIVLIVPATLITVLFLLILNQSGIDELGRRSRSMGVTFGLRRENFRLTSSMLILFAGLFLLMLIVFTGLYFLGKLLVRLILTVLFSSGGEPGESVMPTTTDFFTGGVMQLPGLNQLFFYIFIVLAILAFVIFIVRMHTLGRGIRLREIPGRILAFFQRLLALILGLFRREPTERKIRPQPTLPYQDTVRVAAPSRGRYAADSFEEYQRRLRAIADPKEQFCYAYGTLISGWRKLDPHRPNAVEPCLTPREICAKMLTENRCDLSEITDLYEAIRYADDPRNFVALPRLTARLSGYVEQYFRLL